MIIDGVGYDQEAMAQMTEQEFVKLHLENGAIGFGKEDREKYLKSVYAQLVPGKPKKEKQIPEKPAE